MENTKLHLLNDSFNRELSDAEHHELKTWLQADEALQAEAAKLRKLHSIVGQAALPFRPFFATRVMSRLEKLQEETLTQGITFAFKRLALPLLAAALVLLLIALTGSSTFSLDSLLGVDQLQPAYLSDFILYNP
jgi:anti-sigma factor RsiW